MTIIGDVNKKNDEVRDLNMNIILKMGEESMSKKQFKK